MRTTPRISGRDDPRRDRASCPTKPSTRSSLVLDEIRLGRSRSRSELVARTGLGRAIVAQRVGELIERGLVVEGDVGPEHRRPAAAPAHVPGRRRPRPRRRPGRHEHRRRRDRPSTAGSSATTTSRREIEAGPEACLDRVDELFDQLLRDDPRHPRAGCGGSGSACRARSSSRPAGPISPPIMPGWDGYPIRERFADRYGAPVWVDNDVNVLALGEWRSGVAAGHDDVVVVKIGTGIGAGIISDGRLHRGAQGSAGDVGHIQVTDDPAVVCRCGNVGCLEALAGGAAIGRAGAAAARDGRSGRLRTALDQRGGSPRRTSPARRRSGTRSRSPCSRPPAAGSARCSRASSTSSTRR